MSTAVPEVPGVYLRAFPYEAALHKIRQARGWDLGGVQWLTEARLLAVDPQSDLPLQAVGKARNDHQPIRRFRLLLAPLDYLVSGTVPASRRRGMSSSSGKHRRKRGGLVCMRCRSETNRQFGAGEVWH